MPEIKSRQTYFLKRAFSAANTPTEWETTINVPFDVDDLIVRAVHNIDMYDDQYLLEAPPEATKTRVLPEKKYLYTVHMAGIGDICAIKPETEGYPNTVFPINGRVSGAQKFSIRDIDTTVVATGLHTGSLLLQLDFVRYVRPDSPLYHKPPLMK